MLGRCMLVASLFLATAMTGCIGGNDDGTLEAAAADNESINTAAPDGTKLVAFEETNATEEGVGGLDHHHDMWNGQTRVTIFEQQAAMDPFPDGQNRAVATFQPVQGALVYEATQQVEFTVSDPERRACYPLLTIGGKYVCSDGDITFRGVTVPEIPRPADPTGGPSGMKLRYKHAGTTQWIDVGELKWGEPLPIRITDPRQTDMPHATSSLWEFQVVSPNPHDITLVFKAKAELVKGDADIPLWPGHPNFYSERTSREVLNVQGAESCDQAGCNLAQGEVKPIFAERLISYGTRSLHVWVNITDAQFPNPATQPQTWFLYHRNATGRENITNPFDSETPIEKREHYWVFPVDDNSMDSPYADGSRWNFELGASLTTPVISCYGNCADWYAKYDMVIHASSIELPKEEYTYYCLSANECPE